MPPDPLALALRRRGSMARSAVLSVAALAFLAGCAGEGGWKGPGAQPLAEALADCKARTSAMGGKTGRAFAIDTCLSRKGWTPQRRQRTRNSHAMGRSERVPL